MTLHNNRDEKLDFQWVFKIESKSTPEKEIWRSSKNMHQDNTFSRKSPFISSYHPSHFTKASMKPKPLCVLLYSRQACQKSDRTFLQRDFPSHLTRIRRHRQPYPTPSQHVGWRIRIPRLKIWTNEGDEQESSRHHAACGDR